MRTEESGGELASFVCALDAELDRVAAFSLPPAASQAREFIDVGRLAGAARDSSRFAGLIRLYDLDDVAIAAIGLALAPEVDRRYGEIFSRLNGGACRSPTRSLLLEIVQAAPRLSLLSMLSPTSRLFEERLLRLRNDAEHIGDRGIVVDEQIRQMLLGEPGIDSRLAGFAELSLPAASQQPAKLPGSIAASLGQAVAGFVEGRRSSVKVLVVGEASVGAAAARHLATVLRKPLLTADLALLEASVGEAGESLFLFERESLLQGCVVLIQNVERLWSRQPELSVPLQRLLAGLGPVVVATGRAGMCGGAAEAAGYAPLAVAEPSAAEREALWRETLLSADIRVPDAGLTWIAGRYRLSEGGVHTAVSEAKALLGLGDGGDGQEYVVAALSAAARRQGGEALSELTTRITPRFGWSDIVLTEGVERQLRELCERAVLSSHVLERWGFQRKLSTGRGTAALFAGPPGTGKTMAAEVVATELGIDLFKVNLAGVVSKYIGETEKNLDRIFNAAVRVNGILLFDEADALFGKRAEVKDSRDRYANLEVSYLLQKMEEFDGIAILSSNLHGNLDDAFLRRLSFITYFPFPEPADRERLWHAVWPAGIPMEPIDFASLAAAFKLSGANIKQAALSAAYHAAAEGAHIGARHVLRGIEREFQKMGRPLQKSEIVPFTEAWRVAS